MTKREFLDKVFALVPNEANKIMDAFDEYVDSNEPHWIPVTESCGGRCKNVHYGRQGRERDMMDEEIRQALSEVREMKQMCGNINMKLTNIVTQRGQNWKAKLEAEYQRGLEDAWEAARKIADMWETMDNEDLLETFGVTAKIGESVIGTLFKKQTANEAMLELETYEEKQQTDDKIVVGDEVEWDNDFTGDRFIVTRIYQPYGKKEQCDGIDDDGDVYRAVLVESLVKTGRHFDIASILKEMQS